MAGMTRRSALVGAAVTAAAGVAPVARADMPTALAAHPAFSAWTPSNGRRLPLQQSVQTGDGVVPLSQWLGRRPAVVALWATWCAPCLLEKPHQAALAQRLARAGASTRVVSLQAFDDADVSYADARWMLDQMGAQSLPLARATPGAEVAFRDVFGAPHTSRVRATLPAVLLIGGDGLELGRSVGMMRGAGGHDYWSEESTFDFLSRLD